MFFMSYDEDEFSVSEFLAELFPEKDCDDEEDESIYSIIARIKRRSDPYYDVKKSWEENFGDY